MAGYEGLLYIERVRDDDDDSVNTREDFLRVAASLPPGSPGFGRRVVGLDDRGFPPGWMVPSSIAVSHDGRRWAAGAFLSHQALGLSSALDGSAIDSRNLFWDREDLMVSPVEQLVVGTTDGSAAPMVAAYTGGVGDVGFLPDGKILSVEWYPQPVPCHHLVVTDPVSWERRIITTFSGGVTRFSIHPGGRWAIFQLEVRPVIIDLETGNTYTLDVIGYFTWWPSAGPGTMLGCSLESGHPRLLSHDLTTGITTDLGPLEHQTDLEPFRWFPRFLDVSADGIVAGISGLDLDVAHARSHGDGGRVHIVDLETRTMSPIGPTFLNDGDRRFLRLHERHAWMRHASAPLLDPSGLRMPNPVAPSEAIPPDLTYVYEEANDVAVKAMMAVNEQSAKTGNRNPPSMGAIGVFVPAALRCIRSQAPERFEEVADYCAMASVFAMGNPDPGGPGWQRALSREIIDIREGRDGPPHPLDPNMVEPSATAPAGSRVATAASQPPAARPPGPSIAGGVRDKGATRALLLAIVGFFLCPFLLSPAAIYFGAQARSRISASQGALTGDGAALAGIVIGALGIVYAVVLLLQALLAAA